MTKKRCRYYLRGHLQVLIMCNVLCLIYFTLLCVSEVLKFYITEILVKPHEDGECDITQLSLESKPNSIRLLSYLDLFILLSCVDDIQSKLFFFYCVSNRQRFLEQTLASRLIELSSAQSIFRFSIQTPDGEAVILVRTLNIIYVQYCSFWSISDTWIQNKHRS